MDWLSISVISLALAMDAFAVAVGVGVSLSPLTKRRVFRLAFHFGLFQSLMPVAGWWAGRAVYRELSGVDHWIAFGLLSLVGGKMMWSVWRGDGEKKLTGDPTAGIALVLLSIATSIDALALGLSLALTGSTILLPAMVIGLVAAALTAVGMTLGRRIGSLWGKRVELLGGAILIAIGVKIVLDHLFG